MKRGPTAPLGPSSPGHINTPVTKLPASWLTRPTYFPLSFEFSSWEKFCKLLTAGTSQKQQDRVSVILSLAIFRHTFPKECHLNKQTVKVTGIAWGAGVLGWKKPPKTAIVLSPAPCSPHPPLNLSPSCL